MQNLISYVEPAEPESAFLQDPHVTHMQNNTRGAPSSRDICSTFHHIPLVNQATN